MIGWFDSFPWRRVMFLVFVLFVLLSSAFEIASEFNEGQKLSEMIDDVGMFLISLAVVLMFLREYRHQQSDLKKLQAQLDSSRGQLEKTDATATRIASQYREVMQKQFDVWKLTASEQDVVLALLKGLSFREVAAVRDTREKTVRQQAASVYKKAGVAGRHELAGWFFEDMLEQPARQSR